MSGKSIKLCSEGFYSLKTYNNFQNKADFFVDLQGFLT